MRIGQSFKRGGRTWRVVACTHVARSTPLVRASFVAVTTDGNSPFIRQRFTLE